ncbi:MAG TPA: sulfotransferase [Gemmatimonadales bacterium]|nr:sulfotransferase [Gemmatimonadales bacterium]
MSATGNQGIREIVKRPLRRLRADYRELTGPLRGLPSLLILGAQRSGSTSLFNYLVQHPDVLPPLGKEIHYFDLHYQRGLNWYRGRFPYAHRLRGGTLTLDASPYYLLHPLAPERAARLLPGAKLVALLRNPVERALSHYQHEVRGGRESLPFERAIEQEAERLSGEEERLRSDPTYYSFNHHRYSYVRRGRYLEQLRRWVEHFPRSQLLVLQSERLFADPVGVTATVHEFLGVRPHRLEHYKPFLHGAYDRAMPAGVRTRLVEYFEPHNRELYDWLGKEFDWA